jgi:hypothetical protein
MTTFEPDERRVAIGRRGMTTSSTASVAVTATSATDGEPAPTAMMGVLVRRAEDPKSLPSLGKTSGIWVEPAVDRRRELAAPGRPDWQQT